MTAHRRAHLRVDLSLRAGRRRRTREAALPRGGRRQRPDGGAAARRRSGRVELDELLTQHRRAGASISMCWPSTSPATGTPTSAPSTSSTTATRHRPAERCSTSSASETRCAGGQFARRRHRGPVRAGLSRPRRPAGADGPRRASASTCSRPTPPRASSCSASSPISPPARTSRHSCGSWSTTRS